MYQSQCGKNRPARPSYERASLFNQYRIQKLGTLSANATKSGPECVFLRGAMRQRGVEQTVEQNSPEAARQRQQLPITARLTC